MNKQGAMWSKERDIWKEEDARLQAKIKKINADNISFLKAQEDAKKGGKNNKKMESIEKQINKGLMKEIKQKQRALK